MRILDTPIYVLSYRRALMSTTQHVMLELGFKNIAVCVRPSELDDYKDRTGGYCRYLQIPEDVNGLAGTRQFLLDKIKDQFYVVMDDDITRFSVKHSFGVLGGLKPAGVSEVHDAFRDIYDFAKKNKFRFAASLPERFTLSRPSAFMYQQYGFMRQCLFMGAALRKEVRFDRLKVLLDIDYSLQVMKAGIPMRIARWIGFESRTDAYTPERGGFGLERAKMLLRAGSQEDYDKRIFKALYKLHGDVIEMQDGVKKRINWKLAYEIGQRGVNKHEAKHTKDGKR